MLISEFARQANLSPDTVRFYVKRGLLKPEAGRRGGANPYQEFSAADVARAHLVKLAQSLGFTLREISAIAAELDDSGLPRKRRIAIIEERLGALDDKAAELARMTTYLRAKLAWMKAGEKGPEPTLGPVGEEATVAGLLDRFETGRPPGPKPRSQRRGGVLEKGRRQSALHQETGPK